MREERAPEFPRGLTLQTTTTSGEVLEPPAAGRPSGLFARDLDLFVTRIRTGDREGAYVPSEVVAGVARLADAIDASIAAVR